MVTVGYGVGLIQAWSVLWAWTLVVSIDARGGGTGRIERRKVHGEKGFQEMEGLVDGNELNQSGAESKSLGHELDGEAKDGKVRSKRDENEVDGETRDGLRRRRNETRHDEEVQDNGETRFVWQKLPSTLWHRVDLVTDLVTNFRGVRWSHQISGLPYPDISSLSAFAEPISHQSPRINSSGSQFPSRLYPSRSALLRYNLISFFLTLAALDILKFIYVKDPYYWGLPDPGPSPFPFPRTSRLLISLAAIYASLNIIFVLSPLVFACFAGERLLGEHGWPWLYPPLFGSPKEIWRHGLAGFWGGWWHQMFRLAFEQVGEHIAKPLGWKKKSVKGGILRVVVAFVASGTLHACASYTSLGETHPSHAFLFFAAQPLGLLTQRAVARWMKKVGLRDRIPAEVRGAVNLGFVVAWFWLTGPMVADDFARCGIWLYEPFPISPSRGLAGDGWWRRGGSWLSWHRDEKWWKSGLVI